MVAVDQLILGMATADPDWVRPGETSLLTVVVTPGENPTSTGIGVTCDLSPLVASAAQSFFDDGSNGDAYAGDNTFSYSATVDANM